MSKSISGAFYRGRKWIKCRNGYMSSQHYICERCGSLATICHHKIWLNSENVNDPMVVFNWDNLEALCHDCHNKEHFQTSATREDLKFDSNGKLIIK